MKRLLCMLCVLVACASIAGAQLRIDISDAERPFNVGVRMGLNTSNLSSNQLDLVPDLHSTSVDWKAGFTGGVVIDIIMRNFFALQPGFFFETRSCSFSHVQQIGDPARLQLMEGTQSSSYFKIPILASFRVLVTDDLEWQMDFGPYFSFGLGGNEKYTYVSPGNDYHGREFKRDYFGDKGFVRSYDWGFKMGMGLSVMKHYYVGIHYEAGCRNVLLPNAYNPEPVLYGLKGHNKAWDFTIGYTF